MGKAREYYEKIDRKGKRSFIVYIILRILVLICILLEFQKGNYTNVLLGILTLLLFTIPNFLEDTLKIEFPSMMESIIYIFTFAAEILGEINNFYELIPCWDVILHGINGFICAGLGFSLVDILNTNNDKINLSPMYLAIVAFCFSMTIAVFWEFFEFSIDHTLKKDMQKDTVINEFYSVNFDESKNNIPILVEDIDETIIKTKDKDYVVKGYLDIGLNDTIYDMFVNFIGAAVFSVLGGFYVVKRDDKSFIKNFIPRKRRKIIKES